MGTTCIEGGRSDRSSRRDRFTISLREPIATVTRAPLVISETAPLVALRRRWDWVLTLGIALIVVGGLACAFALTATLATVLALGSLMLVGCLNPATTGRCNFLPGARWQCHWCV
jgi:hypothetical protein